MREVGTSAAYSLEYAAVFCVLAKSCAFWRAPLRRFSENKLLYCSSGEFEMVIYIDSVSSLLNALLDGLLLYLRVILPAQNENFIACFPQLRWADFMRRQCFFLGRVFGWPPCKLLFGGLLVLLCYGWGECFWRLCLVFLPCLCAGWKCDRLRFLDADAVLCSAGRISCLCSSACFLQRGAVFRRAVAFFAGEAASCRIGGS